MKISERGQITIPKPLRNRFGLYKNVEIEMQETDMCVKRVHNYLIGELNKKIVCTSEKRTQRGNNRQRRSSCRYFEQKDYGGIAEKLRCSEAGARSHVSKALATLKTKFATLAKREH